VAGFRKQRTQIQFYTLKIVIQITFSCVHEIWRYIAAVEFHSFNQLQFILQRLAILKFTKCHRHYTQCFKTTNVNPKIKISLNNTRVITSFSGPPVYAITRMPWLITLDFSEAKNDQGRRWRRHVANAFEAASVTVSFPFVQVLY